MLNYTTTDIIRLLRLIYSWRMDWFFIILELKMYFFLKQEAEF